MTKTEKIRQMLADGTPVSQISKKLDVSASYIYTLRAKGVKKAKVASRAKTPAKTAHRSAGNGSTAIRSRPSRVKSPGATLASSLTNVSGNIAALGSALRDGSTTLTQITKLAQECGWQLELRLVPVAALAAATERPAENPQPTGPGPDEDEPDEPGESDEEVTAAPPAAATLSDEAPAAL